MKFNCTQEDLMRSVDLMDSVVSTHKILPILENMRIETREGQIEFQATNMEVSMKNVIPAEIEETGIFTVPCRKFVEIVRHLPAAEVEVALAPNNRVHINYDNGQFILAGLPDDEFPLIPTISTPLFEVSGEMLCGMIGDTQAFASKDMSRLSLMGVYFDLLSNPQCFVGSDSRRIAISTREDLMQENEDELSGFIVSQSTCQKVAAAFLVSPIVKVGIEENVVVFSDDETEVTGKLINAEFPDYQKVIPKADETRNEIIFNTTDLKRCIKRIMPLSDDKTFRVGIEINENSTQLSCQNEMEGEAYESIPSDIAVGEIPIQLSLDIRHFDEALKPIQSNRCRIRIKDEKSMIMIRSDGDEIYKHFMMPML